VVIALHLTFDDARIANRKEAKFIEKKKKEDAQNG
jgi:hypothetical protein